MARRKQTPKRGRPDQRYKDAAAAPVIVNEKRLTFFLAMSVYRDLRLQAGYSQVLNAQTDTDDRLPESPSALVREAIEYWLDHFAPAAGRHRSEREWDERLDTMRAATKRG